MLPLLGKFFDTSDREISKLQSIVDKVNSFAPQIEKLKDEDFPKRTEKLKKKVAEGTPIDDILPEAFALVREAASRTLGLRHYDVQLMAAIVLSVGNIAEQKTGEGKTMSAVPALYLNSLTGKGVHLVTVNDYLARRDAGWMGPIFHFLGVSIASMINDQSFIYDPSYKAPDANEERLKHLRPISRKEAYEADVLYGINSEFGFDYLRDNMARTVEERVQRNFYYAIVDEVDSVLIDEARTPHIISAPDEAPSAKYYEYAKVVDKLSSDVDYKIDEKMRTAHLTDHGIGKIEKLFGLANIYEQDFDTVYHLEAALKARTLFHKEKDYIVKDNEVILVDEFTGRLMEGRRLSEGLHQAIEAKENVPIQRESRALATVSLQNYFRMYEKLAGMTGTAVTEAEEFNKIYKLDVVVIPTHNNTAREDLSDVVYKTTRAKLSAVAEEVARVHQTGQPVLIGTTSIEKNEMISQLLKRKGVKHEVLNAKNHAQEAQIIAQAGKVNAVTVATNMAGRGVDIILGGAAPEKKAEMKKWEKDHQAVLDLGGLYVIGTERHESRRIDNQLRGRSGRQGDPGKSQFFVALDDEIMRLFGGDRIAGLMTKFNMPEDQPLTHSLVSKAIENAQVKVEGFYFDSRKQVVEYDDVLNKQREIIYKERRRIVEAQADDGTQKEEVLERIHKAVEAIVVDASNASFDESNDIDTQTIRDFTTIVPFDEHSQGHLAEQLRALHTTEEKVEFLHKLATDIYEQREQQMTKEVVRNVERQQLLQIIDTLWTDHLDAIEHLRQGVQLRGYAQRDPLVEYKNEAYTMFQSLLATIDDQFVHLVYRYQITDQPIHTHVNLESYATNVPEGEQSDGVKKKSANSKQQKVKNTQQLGAGSEIQEVKKADSVINKDKLGRQAELGNNPAKLGRNDPCWCGSGKKYKKCHYPN